MNTLKLKQCNLLIEQFKFNDGSFDFLKFFNFFMEKDITEGNITYKSYFDQKKKKKTMKREINEIKIKKKLKKFTINKNENNNNNKSLINPFDLYCKDFFNIKSFEKNNSLNSIDYFNLIYNDNINKKENNKIGFWLEEDSDIYGKNIIQIKMEAYDYAKSKSKSPNEKSVFKIIDDKKNFISMLSSNLNKMKSLLLKMKENYEFLLKKKKTINPDYYYNIKKNTEISSDDLTMIELMKLCAFGHTHDPKNGMCEMNKFVEINDLNYKIPEF